MKVWTLRSEPFSANLHLVDCGRDEWLLVDAGTGVDHARVEAQIRKVVDPARIKRVYLTHWHCDHVGGAAALARLTGAEVLVHRDEADVVARGDGRATLAAFAGLPSEPCPCTGVSEGDAVEVGDRRFEILLVPGHTPAHTALWDPATRSLFGGDLVFPMGSFGRVDFPGGDPAALVRSLRKVSEMEVANLYPGHMEPLEGDAAEAIAWSLESAREMLGVSG